MCALARRCRSARRISPGSRSAPSTPWRSRSWPAEGRSPRPADRRPPRVIDEREVRRVLDDFVGGRRQAMADPLAMWAGGAHRRHGSVCAPRVRSKRSSVATSKTSPTFCPSSALAYATRGSSTSTSRSSAPSKCCASTLPPVRRPGGTCGVLLVDEFQDLTPAHVLLIRFVGRPDRRGVRRRR